MSTQRNLDSIFLKAVQIECEKERSNLLARECGTDLELLRQVEELLRSHQEAGSFLLKPAPGVAESRDDTLDANIFTSPDALVIGNVEHSVLKSLHDRFETVPRVLLRQPEGDEGLVARPRSNELPQGRAEERYQLHGEIARGGMGAILKGRDADLGRELAIKVLLDDHKDDPEAIERFIEEAQIGGQLQHPGIVPVYQLGQFDDRPFFTMKLVKGKTLATLFSARTSLDHDRAHLLGVFEQVCQTLAYAHSRGVIHRDMKPSNIMVGAFGEVQVMDWGLAKVLAEGGVADEKKSLEKHQEVSIIRTRRSLGSGSDVAVGSQTNMGSVMGTPAYMPPEQALGEIDRLDERADVFGLGAILCELLTGKPPYVADDPREVYRLACRGSLSACFERLEQSGADQELLDLTKHALASEPQRRLPDARAVAERMTSYLSNVQERLRHAELAQATAQTRRKLSATIAILMLCVAAGAIFSAVHFRRLVASNQELLEGTIQKQQAAEAATNRAETKTRELTQQLRVSRMTRLAALSRSYQQQRPVESLALALEAFAVGDVIDDEAITMAREALLSASADIGGWPLGSNLPVRAVEVSPDGRWLVTGTSIGEIRLWDRTQGGAPTEFMALPGHVEAVADLDISPDSRWLASVGHDGTARLWDLHSRTPTSSGTIVVRTAPQRLMSVAFGPQGRWLAMGCEDGSSRLLDLRVGKYGPALTLPGHNWYVRSVRFASNGKWLATRGLNRALLWDLEAEDITASGQALESCIADTLAMTPDSTRLVIGGRPGTAVLWDLDEAACLRQELPQFDGHVVDLEVSPNGRWLVTADLDTTRVWDLEGGGRLEQPLVLQEHRGAVTRVAISDDSRWLVTGSDDRTARLWELGTNAPSKTIFRGHDSGISDIAISPGGKWLVTAGNDGARWWPLADEFVDATSNVLRGPRRPITSLALSQNREWLAAASALSVWLWKLNDTRPPTLMHVLRGNNGKINSVRVSPDGRWLLTGDEDQTACLWDLDAASIPDSLRVLTGHARTIGGVRFSHDSNRAITRGHDGFVKFWNLQSPLPTPVTIRAGDGRGISTAMLTPDGRLALTASWDGTARVWDMTAEHPTESAVLAHGNIVSRAAISPNGRWVVAGKANVMDKNKALFLWDLHADDPSSSGRILHQDIDSYSVSSDRRWTITVKAGLARLLDIHAEDPAASIRTFSTPWDIHANEVSPNGRWMITISAGKAHLWDLNHEVPKPIALRFHNQAVTCLATGPGNQWAVTGSADGTVCLWDLDINQLLARARQITGPRAPSVDAR